MDAKCCADCHKDVLDELVVEHEAYSWFGVCCVVRLACKDKEAARE